VSEAGKRLEIFTALSRSRGITQAQDVAATDWLHAGQHTTSHHDTLPRRIEKYHVRRNCQVLFGSEILTVRGRFPLWLDIPGRVYGFGAVQHKRTTFPGAVGRDGDVSVSVLAV
jgi:hypothetical protein